jgi:two-component system response regulator ChvI
MSAYSEVTARTAKGDYQPAAKAGAMRVFLVDDEDYFREFLRLHFAESNYSLVEFSNGRALLDCLASGETASVILLDWKMPGMTGLDVLQELRNRGIKTPVVFLTGLGDNTHEEMALGCGAVDFINKSRRISILMQRLELITTGARAIAIEDRATLPDIVRIGKLELRFDINRARWAGQTLDLTLREFQFVVKLAFKLNECVSYRALYDLVHGHEFLAGQGPDGYRVNVRTFIKRIRQKFRRIDPDFAQIQNHEGDGYTWLVS